MKRFRSNSLGKSWTRRATLVSVGAAVSSPAFAQRPSGMALWPVSGPPVLRGAVIAQRRRRESVDGPDAGGGEAVLPKYTTDDFRKLANAGANLVVMSYPEVWTVAKPWKRDEPVAAILSRQIAQATNAGLYVVVALRSGPGRSDFVFQRDAADTWFPKEMIVDSLWRDADAQAAWAAMCVDAARLVAGARGVAGLNIMVEPDANMSGLDRQGRKLDAWTADEYARQVGAVSDWKRFAGDCARGVRAAAPDLPVLISPPAFARPDFLSVMGAPPVSGTVWCIHDYEPRGFTHQDKRARGKALFVDRDRKDFAARLDAAKHAGAPVFLGEFGAARWGEGAPDYYSALIAECETRGVGWAAFRWPTSDREYERLDDTFNVSWGAGIEDTEGAALPALKAGWIKNRARPARDGLRGRAPTP
ncbi:MAG TPA: cellulase family glycosylhydrolase [Hyphomonadaceae bacterium]|nr:cellulase family glycosylhydrolase [Hyphomonadaceae bacterium]